MDINIYAREAEKTRMYPGRGEFRGIAYVTLGLTGEAGETANEVKKISRDDKTDWKPERLTRIQDELGDTLWYWVMLHRELQLNPDITMLNNIDKLAARLTAGKVTGPH